MQQPQALSLLSRSVPAVSQPAPTLSLQSMPSSVLRRPEQRAVPVAPPNWQWPELDAGVTEGRRVNPWRPDTGDTRPGAPAQGLSATIAARKDRVGQKDWLEANWQDYLAREQQRAASARQREEWLQDLQALQQRYPSLP